MATITATAKFRPVRIGFLVREGNLEDVVQAAQLSALLWGGKCNPIIPVSADATLAETLSDLFAVDDLVAVAAAPEVLQFREKHWQLRHPHHYDGLFYEDWGTRKHVLAYLDVINIVDRYWHDDFRHKDKDYKSNCAFVEWDSADPLAPMFTLSFGSYPTSLDLRDDFTGAFRRGLRATETRIGLNGVVDPSIANQVTPMDLAGAELDAYGGGLYESGVYLGDPGNVTDLVAFWNIRAAGPHVRFVPRQSLARVEAFIRADLKTLDARPSDVRRLPPRIAVYHRNCSGSELVAFTARFPTKQGKVIHRVDDLTWTDARMTPMKHFLGWESARGWLAESFGRPVVTLPLPDKKFLGNVLRDEREHTVRSQGLAVSLDVHSDHAYRENTLGPPFLRSLNEFYSREITVDPWMLRVEKDGVAVLIQVSDVSVTLYPLAHDRLIGRLFKTAGIDAVQSQPGRLAARIIESMREYLPLDACRVFKIRGVRKLISEVRAADRLTWDHGVRTIGRAMFDKFKDLYIEPRTKPELEPPDVLAYLIRKRVFAPRVVWWQKLLRRTQPFRCVRCGIETQVLRGTFEGEWRCPYCTHQHYLPEYISTALSRRGVWYLQRSGLFAKNNSQEGALPVILALMTLARVFHTGRFAYSTAFNLTFERKVETDLVVVQYRGGPGRAIEVGIGECKADRGSITEDDIAKLKAARARLGAIGVEVYLLLAKTSDVFSEGELGRFRSLYAEGTPIVLLTNRELELYSPYGGKDAEGLPIRHPFTLADLAANSVARYLEN